MLQAHEFTAGNLLDARGLTLMLPRDEYEQSLLIAEHGDLTMVAILKGPYRFRAFKRDASSNQWRGLLIPDIRIEIDETSVFQPQGSAPLGSLLRSDSDLRLMTRRDDEQFGRAGSIVLLTNLPTCGDGQSVGFTSWQIVLGEGRNRRILYSAICENSKAR